MCRIMQKYPNNDKSTTKELESYKVNKTILHSGAGISKIYLSSELIVREANHESNIFHFYATSSLDYGICPYCGHISRQLHSKYFRTIQDLSILGERVFLYLEVRKFFCHNDDCRRKTFAEQPGNEIFRYRRRTCRCERTIARNGVTVSSNSASRMLSHIGIFISSSTVLRDLHRMKPSKYENVAEIGVDDWAWRKGITYGSIIIDYANRWPIDLLGDRDTESFRQWIEEHGKVHIVSRDRSTDYSSAIASTDRQIIEVADKFHLVKNIMDRITNLVSENYGYYRQAVRRKECIEEKSVEVKGPASVSLVSEFHSKRSDSRKIMFKEVKELQQKGFKPTSIAKKLDIARQTATKYCKMDSLPQRNSKLRNEYYKYDAYVEQEAASGKALSVIHQEIRHNGFSGSLTPFYDHYRYLLDGHRGYRPKNWKQDSKKEKPQDDRSQLLPVKYIASVISKALKGNDLDEMQQKTFDTLISLD